MRTLFNMFLALCFLQVTNAQSIEKFSIGSGGNANSSGNLDGEMLFPHLYIPKAGRRGKSNGRLSGADNGTGQYRSRDYNNTGSAENMEIAANSNNLL